MKGIIRGVGIFLLIASFIALLVLYYCLSRVKKGRSRRQRPFRAMGRMNREKSRLKGRQWQRVYFR
ncbi:MAG: hypothetical protein ACETWC_09850 [Acidobacteriota bacterium]